jgi:hypothetical protein
VTSQVFRPCGPIRKIKLLPAANGDVRGFIDFSFTASAAAALDLNGSADLGGWRVVVGTPRRDASVNRDRVEPMSSAQAQRTMKGAVNPRRRRSTKKGNARRRPTAKSRRWSGSRCMACWTSQRMPVYQPVARSPRGCACASTRGPTNDQHGCPCSRRLRR